MIKYISIALLWAWFTSTGNVFPTSGTTGNRAGGDTHWTNPGNITADDGSISGVTPSAQSHYLVASGFGLSIPAGATILGVTVRIEAYCDFAPNADLRAQLQDDNGSLIGVNKFHNLTGGNVYTVYTYGSASDMWGGASLTPAIVNDADFGLKMWVPSLSDVRVDYVTIAIEYNNSRRIFNSN